MLLPESMSRIVIVGTKSRLDDAIEALYSEKSIHVIDHTTGDDKLSIGAPRPNTSKASERLLKVRGMEKELGVVKHTKTPRVSVEDTRSQINAGNVEDVESQVLKAVDERNDLNQKITELNSRKNTLELLQKLPITMDLYSGYKSLAVLVGTVSTDPTTALQAVDGCECFVSMEKKTGVAAVFVRMSARATALTALTGCGFTEVHVPEETKKVLPAEAIAEIDEEIGHYQQQLDAANLSLEALRSKYAAFLKGTDEELSIEVEKGSVPLRIAVSEYSYIIDAWVPTDKVDRTKADLEQKLGNDVYVEFEETRSRKMMDEEAAEPRFRTPPSKQNNGRITKEFEYATSLVSLPKYQEIDPTILIMIFLPLFFGYMVGDCGYAIPFIIIGAYGLKIAHNKDWRSIATVLFFGGIWAFIFGFFFYGEALGMHFIGMEDGVFSLSHVAKGGTSVTWDWILGVTFPSWFSGLLPVVDGGAGIGKLEDISFLLKLAVYIGIVHLMIGHCCGLVNHIIQRGKKDAFFAKGGAIITFIGMVMLCWALTKLLGVTKIGSDLTMPVLYLSIIVLFVGVIINSKTEGFMAIMDLPGIIGNILSYTRLAAIAMSKAGMALAFNYIIFGMIIPRVMVGGIYVADWSNIAMLALAIVMFAFLHLVVWTLAILSGGLHALRLQYVELMTKFYEGNGTEFAPLKENRIKTFFSEKAKVNTKEV